MLLAASAFDRSCCNGSVNNLNTPKDILSPSSNALLKHRYTHTRSWDVTVPYIWLGGREVNLLLLCLLSSSITSHDHKPVVVVVVSYILIL